MEVGFGKIWGIRVESIVFVIFIDISESNGLERKGERGFEYWGNYYLGRFRLIVVDIDVRIYRFFYVSFLKECGLSGIGKKV